MINSEGTIPEFTNGIAMQVMKGICPGAVGLSYLTSANLRLLLVPVDVFERMDRTYRIRCLNGI